MRHRGTVVGRSLKPSRTPARRRDGGHIVEASGAIGKVWQATMSAPGLQEAGASVWRMDKRMTLGGAPLSSFATHIPELHLLRRTDGPASRRSAVESTYAGAMQVNRLLAERFGRMGWDGAGSDLEIMLTNNLGAAWLGRYIQGEPAFTKSASVLAHEAGHGIFHTEVARRGGDIGAEQLEAKALDEFTGDVVAVAMQRHDDWQIGSGIKMRDDAGRRIRYIRDLAAPPLVHAEQLRSPDPWVVENLGGSRSHWSAYDEIIAKTGHEPHRVSGIPGLAIVRASRHVGARDDVLRSWYHTVRDTLEPTAGLRHAAAAHVDAARDLDPRNRDLHRGVIDGWRSVGLLD